LRQRVALVATLARLYVGIVLIDRECECRGHRRRIVGVVYDHMCQQQCDQRIGYAARLRPGNMSQIGARSAYLALRDFDPANVSCGSEADLQGRLPGVCFGPEAEVIAQSSPGGNRVYIELAAKYLEERLCQMENLEITLTQTLSYMAETSTRPMPLT